jgi:AraC family transcriptional regulator of adaptative response / DNA-3-methyladenine glycosylase II
VYSLARARGAWVGFNAMSESREKVSVASDTMDGMTISDVLADADRCYRAAASRDARFDGVFYVAVHTTGIYCRPSCPAITPRRRNVSFYPSAAAAQGAGYRACRRCRPDVTPGSPLWDVKADTTGRAMRLIADGVVDREGVDGLAARTGYTPRHLGRLLTQQLGAGPLALARAQRARTARLLIETTSLSFADVAFAAGFASVRQFNDTVRLAYDATPTELRARKGARHRSIGSGTAEISVFLAARQPFDGGRALGFLRARAVAGIETVDERSYRRSMGLPHGPGHAALTPHPAGIAASFELADLRDLSTAVERCRRLFDLDSDPVAIDDVLTRTTTFAPLVAERPGLRVVGHVDGFEVAVRAVVGQQVSVGGARTTLGRLVRDYGDRFDVFGSAGAVSRLFPMPEVIATVDPIDLPMPRSRGRALVTLATAVADGSVVLDRGADRADVRASLVALPGIGPWTADYIAMRALGDPDVWLGSDLGVVHALRSLGHDSGVDPAELEAVRPWRSYAVMHLWNHLFDPIAKEAS